jgi:uncharacterized membrane protein YdcZ (DUF606 family)
MRALGIILVAAGIVMMVITGVNIVTEEKVVDFGKVEITREENNPVNWSPILGAVLLVGGVIVLLTGNKKMA